MYMIYILSYSYKILEIVLKYFQWEYIIWIKMYKGSNQ